MVDTLFAHQIYGSQMMDNVPILGIAYQTGTGKSATALDHVYKIVNLYGKEDILLLCPASLIPKWREDIEKMRGFEEYTDAGVDRVGQCLTIVSFSKFYKTEKYTVHHIKDGKNYKKGTTSEKERLVLRPEVNKHWDCIIVDESHRIGNRQSKQTHASWKFADISDTRYIMTGTPISGGGEQEDWSKLYGQIKFLEPSRWESWKQFAEEYVLEYDYWGRPSKWRDDACRDLMREYFIFARLSECYDMPERTDTIIPCPLLEPKVYHDFKKKNFAPYGLRIRKSGLTHQKLLQLCAGEVKIDTDLDECIKFKTGKEQALKDIIEGTDDKIVIFAMHKNVIDDIEAICSKYGKTVVYDGRSKTETWMDFQNGDARFLVFSYMKGVEGLNLYSSHTMVFYEPTPVNRDLEQAQARIYRKGQDKHCLFYYLSVTGTIDAEVYRRVIKGETLTTETLEQLAAM